MAVFEHPPGLVAGDRGVHAADTEARLHSGFVPFDSMSKGLKLAQILCVDLL